MSRKFFPKFILSVARLHSEPQLLLLRPAPIYDRSMNAQPPAAAPPPPPPPPHSTVAHSSPLQSHLSLNLLPPSAPSVPSSPAAPSPAHPPLTRIKLSDVAPYEGACSSTFQRAVDALSLSLTRRNAAVLELGGAGEDVAVMRCALESLRMFFRAKDRGFLTQGGKRNRGVYVYRAGRLLCLNSVKCLFD